MIDVIEAVTIVPSVTVHAALVKGPGAARVVPSTLTTVGDCPGNALSSSLNESVIRKSSRFENCGRMTG